MQSEENIRKKQKKLQRSQLQEEKQSFDNKDLKEKSLSLNKDQANYMTLNELDQKKYDLRSKIDDIESYFAEKKKICDYEIGAYSKLTDDYLLAGLDDGPKKKRKDTASTKGKKIEKLTFRKSLSVSMSKSKSSTGYDALNIEEEDFVRRYKDYLARTHYLQEKFKDNLSDDDRQWDHRGIKSQNNRVYKRNLKNEDSDTEYSYYSISADGFESAGELSVDISFDKEAVKKKKRQPPQKIKRETKKQFSPFPELNAKLGFFRMIYSVLDKVKDFFIIYRIRMASSLKQW